MNLWGKEGEGVCSRGRGGGEGEGVCSRGCIIDLPGTYSTTTITWYITHYSCCTSQEISCINYENQHTIIQTNQKQRHILTVDANCAKMRSLHTVPSFSEYLAARNRSLYIPIITNETNIYNIDTFSVLHKKCLYAESRANIIIWKLNKRMFIICWKQGQYKIPPSYCCTVVHSM